MEISHFIQPLGIATLTSLVITLVLGLTRRKNPRLLIPWHRIQAFVTLGLAVAHFLVVFFSE